DNVFAFVNLSAHWAVALKVSGRYRGLLALPVCPSCRRQFLPRRLQNAQASASSWFRQSLRAKEARHLNRRERKTNCAEQRSKEYGADWSGRIPSAGLRMR